VSKGITDSIHIVVKRLVPIRARKRDLVHCPVNLCALFSCRNSVLT
jgi:hypothetical protein